MKIIERKIQGISGSLFVSLPKGWADSLHLKKGAILKLAITPKGTIMLSPEIIKSEEKKESVIEYDEHIIRRFLREYFSGYEEIIIKFSRKIKPDEKKELYAFLKKFMNVQIIEDTEQKIVLKSFKIEELSIEDCLKRMFFLTLNMIEELQASNDKVKLQEIERNVKRFYYLLVMQIRRFIGEGKFADENQISLVRAMDCRMTGMKIDDIAGTIMESESIKSKNIRKMLEDTTEFYKKAFSEFINNNYEKAIGLWVEEKKIEQKYCPLVEKISKNRNIDEYKQICDLFQVLKLAKRISMLVR